MTSIKSIEEKKEKNIDPYEQRFLDLLNKGIKIMRAFAKVKDSSYDLDLLYKASSLFLEASMLKRDKPEPYFYLAYIFYVMGVPSRAEDQLRVVTFIDPYFPGLENLKQEVESAINSTKGGGNYISEIQTPQKLSKVNRSSITSKGKVQSSKIEPKAITFATKS